MNNHSRKTKLTALIMLLSLLLTLFSACADTVQATYTAEMPTIESVVGYSADITTIETDSAVKLSETSTWDGATATYFAGGDGSADSPYQIETAGQLALLANIINGGEAATVISGGSVEEYATLQAANYKLTANIDLNEGYTFEFDADTGLVAIAKSGQDTIYLGTGIAGDDSGENEIFDSTASTAGAYYANTSGTSGTKPTDLNEWTAIGYKDDDVEYSFQGTFDGGGNTISGLYINSTIQYAGLFGYVSGSAVQNLNVTNSSITVNTTYGASVGGVVGYNTSSTVSNCSFAGSITAYGTSNAAYVGGIVGYNYNSTVINCSSAGTVTAYNTNNAVNVGGVVGYNRANGGNAIVSNCYNTGDVTGTSTSSSARVGGVVGYNHAFSPYTATVSNCYNTGDVTGTSTSSTAYVGGVVGYNHTYSGTVTVSNSYNTGRVTGTASSTASVGGVVGYNYNQDSGIVTVSNCYAFSGITVTGNTGSSPVSVNDITLIGNNTGKYAGLATFGTDGNLGTVDNDTSGTTATVSVGTDGTYKTLLSALNAYVTENSTSGYSSWFNASGNEVGEAFAMFIPTTYWIATDDPTYVQTEDYYDISWYTAGNNATYTISTSAQLAGLSALVNGMAVDGSGVAISADTFSGDTITLANDIDISAHIWTPIGTDSTYYFAGTFDGGGNTISGLYINSTGNSSDVYVGLFGYVNAGTIQNVGVINSSITVSTSAYTRVGGVVGYNYDSTVSDCYFEGTVSGTSSSSAASLSYALVGGVVGDNNTGSTVSNCYFEGAVSGTSTESSSGAYVGGVVGNNFNSTVSNCYNTGTVTGAGKYAYVGGVVGDNYGNTVSNCYNTGDVSGTASTTANVGGVVGCNYNGTVSNSYAFSGITVTNSSGGTTPITTANLIGTDNNSNETSNVTTFSDSGAVTLSVNYSSCTTLLSALNAYVDENPTAGLRTWVDNTNDGATAITVGSAPALLDTYPLLVTFVDGNGATVNIYSDGSAEYADSESGTLDATLATGWQAITQGATYIKIDGTEGSNNTLPAGNYYLAEDIQTTSTITISGTVNLTLNGHVIDAQNTSDTSVITVTGSATLNLYDTAIPEANGYTYYDDGKFDYTDSEYEPDDGSYTQITAITGGLMTGGTGTGDSGGGVYINSYGTFNMYGGSIAGNETFFCSGGVNIDSNGEFNMYGGSIAGNKAFLGGGVFVSGTFNMYGGSIASNDASSSCGGVYVSSSFNISGTPIISGNTLNGETASNVYLLSEKYITITDALTDGANIGVTMAATMGQFTAVGTASASDTSYFFSDISGYKASYNSDSDGLELIEYVEDTTTSSSSSSSSRISLDTSAPTITADGDAVTIYDKNLTSITINGEEIEITDSTMVIDFSAYPSGEYQITATDKYGRVTTQVVTVSSEEKQTETETPAATTAPVATQTPTATAAPTVDANPQTNGGYAVWIILGVIALGVVGFVIYKKKSNK